ncbi:MAG: polymer-forming cytoskeletal protein, partial [Gammaproteobacteria bacterium]|nr:polymer-forming cytoskeletal protein [Gammaproteobacteria bacterium]
MRLDYRIIVRTEGELDAIVNVRLRPLNWFVLLSTVLVLGWLFFGALLLYTPLGGYMPGAANRDWQRQVVEQTRRLDSLEEVLQTSRSQWSVLRREWLGEDSLLYQDLPLPTVGQNYRRATGVVMNAMAEGAVLEGNLTCKGDLRLDGTVQGEVRIEGRLVIGAQGSIHGPVRCQNVHVLGKVNGPIEATESILLSATAQVNGDITAP